MKDRIKLVRKTAKLTQTEFGEMFGVTLSAVQKWELGINVPTDAIIELMCQKTSANAKWLKTGIGEPFISKTRADEMGDLIAELMADSTNSFRTRLITALLRFKPDSPEWALLEEIYNSVTDEINKEPDA